MLGLIIILMFVSFWVLFLVLLAYLYAYVLFGVLNLSKRLSVKIGFLVFYAIFTLLILYFGFGAELFLAVPVMILSILILKRKQYFINFTKLSLAIASACLLVYAWQLEVPQKIVFDIASKALKTKVMKEVFIENIDENVTLWRTPNKMLLDCEDKNIACPFFSFKYPIKDIKVRIDGEEKLVARIYGIAYSTSTLTRFLTGITHTKRLRYFTNISK